MSRSEPAGGADTDPDTDAEAGEDRAESFTGRGVRRFEDRRILTGPGGRDVDGAGPERASPRQNSGRTNRRGRRPPGL
jgi:hypothetical protein